MPRSSLYIASYDLEDDRERSRVAKVLEGFGVRVQKSVFECRLTKTALRQLSGRLGDLGMKTGNVLVYRAERDSPPKAIGAAPPAGEATASHAFIA